MTHARQPGHIQPSFRAGQTMQGRGHREAAPTQAHSLLSASHSELRAQLFNTLLKAGLAFNA